MAFATSQKTLKAREYLTRVESARENATESVGQSAVGGGREAAPICMPHFSVRRDSIECGRLSGRVLEFFLRFFVCRGCASTTISSIRRLSGRDSGDEFSGSISGAGRHEHHISPRPEGSHQSSSAPARLSLRTGKYPVDGRSRSPGQWFQGSRGAPGVARILGIVRRHISSPSY